MKKSFGKEFVIYVTLIFSFSHREHTERETIPFTKALH